MDIPQHLKHKPILAVKDYDLIDGEFEKKSDAKALSIGQAQWDNKQLSAKVLRYKDNRWSPQSEELPLHRVLDLANLILSVYSQKEDNYVQNNFLKEEIINEKQLDKVKNYIKNSSHLEKRIKELKNTLNKL